VSGTERTANDQEKEGQAVAQRVPKKRLIDALNHVNFRRDFIIINLEHVRYGSSLSLRAYPQPCTDQGLQCLWVEAPPSNLSMSYVFRSFMVDRGLDLLVAEAEATEMNDAGISLTLPEHCPALQPRRAKRYRCAGVQVTLMQNGATYVGVLEDFASLSLRVLVSAQSHQTFEWIDQETPLYVVLSDGKEVLYSGECRIIRQTETKRQRVLVLEPLRTETGKLSRDRLSSAGLVLVPSPSVAFSHPLTGKEINLEVDEVSPYWFSVIELYDSSVLFSGLVIPAIKLETVPGFSVKCRGQVGQGAVQEANGERTVKWRITLVDMDVDDQGKLFAWLQRLTHRKSRSYGSVDLDDLLTFFFDTGFVYPKKYAVLQSNREQFRETYRKLYLENPAIARHFIQMDKGVIQGHLSMIRFYENTWMIHHHAGMGRHGGGLAVLNEARTNIHDCHYLYSSHMDFLICYFRPTNRFPNRVFGGFARSLDNPKHCSMDSFAYLNFSAVDRPPAKSDGSWELRESDAEDLAELSDFYESSSGGVAVKALDLDPNAVDANTLSQQYERLGFKRKRLLYSLKKDGKLKAVFMAMVSDVGLNMSNLTNCVHVFVTDEEDLTADELRRHVGSLAPQYDGEEFPVLLYPVSYADSQSIPYEKTYFLWAFDCKYTDLYYEYMGKIISGKKGGERDGANPLARAAREPLRSTP
jgi:hypothetical protein